jgi:hypothetical protein
MGGEHKFHLASHRFPEKHDVAGDINQTLIWPSRPSGQIKIGDNAIPAQTRKAQFLPCPVGRLFTFKDVCMYRSLVILVVVQEALESSSVNRFVDGRALIKIDATQRYLTRYVDSVPNCSSNPAGSSGRS